ncbi:hypothetical protein MRB53_011384 [Persea americana]|uniref:Uncharacterized protein n=1 Tax=Persea americana TaxID=3435 RepID=A0ACC2LUP6_PERAE|nr:hypothetical protein MRB53_011384 [Persea americana]
MLGVARLAAELERRILILWRPGTLLCGAAQGDCDWVGEERAEVPMGGAQSALRQRDLTGPGRPTAGGVLGAKEREGAGGELVGAVGVRVESLVGWWVHESLWVELSVGGAMRGGADGGLATVRGAAAEPVGSWWRWGRRWLWRRRRKGGWGRRRWRDMSEVGDGAGMVMRMSLDDLIKFGNESSSTVRSCSSSMLMVGY